MYEEVGNPTTEGKRWEFESSRNGKERVPYISGSSDTSYSGEYASPTFNKLDRKQGFESLCIIVAYGLIASFLKLKKCRRVGILRNYNEPKVAQHGRPCARSAPISLRNSLRVHCQASARRQGKNAFLTRLLPFSIFLKV